MTKEDARWYSAEFRNTLKLYGESPDEVLNDAYAEHSTSNHPIDKGRSDALVALGAEQNPTTTITTWRLGYIEAYLSDFKSLFSNEPQDCYESARTRVDSAFSDGLRQAFIDAGATPSGKNTPNTKPNNNQPTTKEKTTMTSTPTFETKHFVNNINVNELPEDKLIEAIVQLELRIKELGAIQTSSKAIKRKIKELNKTIKKVAFHLDSK